jgi:predicted MPP superfamily phosphohydrolase
VRIAVISDIHGNLHALDAVLNSIADDGPDAVWCLGDLVGYGPRPNRCCTFVAERADVCLIGNHDLGVLGRLDLDDFAEVSDIIANTLRPSTDESALNALRDRGLGAAWVGRGGARGGFVVAQVNEIVDRLPVRAALDARAVDVLDARPARLRAAIGERRTG